MRIEVNPIQWAKLSMINSVAEEPMDKTVFDCIDAGLETYDKVIVAEMARRGIAEGEAHDP